MAGPNPPVPGTAHQDSPAGAAQPSLGDLLGEVTADVQKLFRQEVELAKAEMRQEAVKAAKGAGLLGGAGFAGYMTLVLGSLAAVFGLANVVALGWAALIVAGVWAVAGLVSFMAGRDRLRAVSPKPEQTVETLKEDAQWARHPTQ
jgi:tetrahydromethanopterin S-methyltransferase subunit C